MKTYTVTGTVTISVSTTVEAASVEEAKRIAEERETGSALPSHNEEHLEAWVAEELDGEVEVVGVQEGAL